MCLQIPPPKKKAYKGFTLTEILITLTLIGVIAALTVPTLINSAQQAQYNAGVQNANTYLSGALQTIQANNGGVVHFNAGTDYGVGLRQDFCNVLQCVKTDTVANIFGVNGNSYSFYKGGLINYWIASNDTTYPAAILNNGNYLRFVSYSSCNSATNGGHSGSINACAEIDVDINGFQEPNMWGEDFYQFWIVLNSVTGSYSIEPVGVLGDGSDSGSGICPVGSGAGGCTYQRLYYPNNMP